MVTVVIFVKSSDNSPALAILSKNYGKSSIKEVPASQLVPTEWLAHDIFFYGTQHKEPLTNMVKTLVHVKDSSCRNSVSVRKLQVNKRNGPL